MTTLDAQQQKTLNEMTAFNNQYAATATAETTATASLKAPSNTINGRSSALIKAKTDISNESQQYRTDGSWVKQAFIVLTEDLDAIDANNRSFSSAFFKYTDSSLGGNVCINPPPAFTRYADVPEKGIRADATDTTVQYHPGHIGMGSYYSEAIDDNNQNIHIRFGVPSYNSLTQFFTGFYSSSAASVARTGRYDDSFLSKFLGFAKGLVTIAILPLLILPVAFMMAGEAFRYFMKWPASKFYYLKPSMPIYWSAVSSMVNQLGVNKGIINYVDTNQYQAIMGQPAKFSHSDLSVFASIFPEFSKNGLIDIYAIANKSKRLEIRFRNQLSKQLTQGGDGEWYGVVKKVMAGDPTGNAAASSTETRPFALESFLSKWISAEHLGKTSDKNGAGVEKDLRQGTDISGMDAEHAAAAMADPSYTNTQNTDDAAGFFLANLADGSEWATFRVDYTGPVGESFSNSTSPSTLAQKINSTSANSRNMKINMAEGNIDGAGIASTVLGAAGSILQTTADTLHIGGLAAFAGNALIDIPDNWESHSASLPKSTYTMTLISPYGNPISQMFSIYVPLCMILAGVLPLATGKQSYQSPFLCELYDRGRSITRLGVIDSLSIQRGTSNYGFNPDGQAMALEVSFSIKDLSSIIAMPIQQGFSSAPLEGIFDGENAFSDYLMVLSNLSLRDVTDRVPMLKYQMNRKMADIGTFFSSSHIASYCANLPGINAIGALFRGTEKK